MIRGHSSSRVIFPGLGPAVGSNEKACGRREVDIMGLRSRDAQGFWPHNALGFMNFSLLCNRGGRLVTRS